MLNTSPQAQDSRLEKFNESLKILEEAIKKITTKSKLADFPILSSYESYDKLQNDINTFRTDIENTKSKLITFKFVKDASNIVTNLKTESGNLLDQININLTIKTDKIEYIEELDELIKKCLHKIRSFKDNKNEVMSYINNFNKYIFKMNMYTDLSDIKIKLYDCKDCNEKEIYTIKENLNKVNLIRQFSEEALKKYEKIYKDIETLVLTYNGTSGNKVVIDDILNTREIKKIQNYYENLKREKENGIIKLVKNKDINSRNLLEIRDKEEKLDNDFISFVEGIKVEYTKKNITSLKDLLSSILDGLYSTSSKRVTLAKYTGKFKTNIELQIKKASETTKPEYRNKSKEQMDEITKTINDIETKLQTSYNKYVMITEERSKLYKELQTIKADITKNENELKIINEALNSMRDIADNITDKIIDDIKTLNQILGNEWNAVEFIKNTENSVDESIKKLFNEMYTTEKKMLDDGTIPHIKIEVSKTDITNDIRKLLVLQNKKYGNLFVKHVEPFTGLYLYDKLCKNTISKDPRAFKCEPNDNWWENKDITQIAGDPDNLKKLNESNTLKHELLGKIEELLEQVSEMKIVYELLYEKINHFFKECQKLMIYLLYERIVIDKYIQFENSSDRQVLDNFVLFHPSEFNLYLYFKKIRTAKDKMSTGSISEIYFSLFIDQAYNLLEPFINAYNKKMDRNESTIKYTKIYEYSDRIFVLFLMIEYFCKFVYPIRYTSILK